MTKKIEIVHKKPQELNIESFGNPRKITEKEIERRRKIARKVIGWIANPRLG